ncbi:MAG: GNAT family N-acetyltransferase [Acidobacteriota bacterium]
MQLTPTHEELAQRYAADIPELVHSTGPISYDYHFDRRELFDEVVTRSWLAPGTLFGADRATLALDGDELLGIEIGFHGPEFRERIQAMAPLWGGAIEEGVTTEEEIGGVLERSDAASWLNPVIQPDLYYIHAIAVKPEHRGKKVGVALMENAMQQGREAGYKKLQLDVLSDNPAVQFYYSQGLELLVESRAPKPEAFGVPPEYRMGMKL